MASSSQIQSARARRIAIVADDAGALRRDHADLLRELVGANHRVLCVAPTPRTNDTDALQRLGAACRDLAAASAHQNLLSRWLTTDPLIEVLIDWQPHVVLGIGGSAMSRAMHASQRASISHIVALPGRLPVHRFSRSASDGELSSREYAAAFKAAHRIVLQNAEDHHLLRGHNLLPPDTPVVITPATGIDPTRDSEQPFPPTTSGLIFLMTARLDRSSGVIPYCEAATNIKNLEQRVRFILAHRSAHGEGAMIAEQFNDYAGAVELVDDSVDNSALLTAAHVFVYPSYGEATPKDIVAAMSIGRPIITTDVPGCRDTVDERVNGYIVAPGDIEALTATMTSAIRQHALLASMGHASRLKAERRYDVREINRTLSAALELY